MNKKICGPAPIEASRSVTISLNAKGMRIVTQEKPFVTWNAHQREYRRLNAVNHNRMPCNGFGLVGASVRRSAAMLDHFIEGSFFLISKLAWSFF